MHLHHVWPKYLNPPPEFKNIKVKIPRELHQKLHGIFDRLYKDWRRQNPNRKPISKEQLCAAMKNVCREATKEKPEWRKYCQEILNALGCP